MDALSVIVTPDWWAWLSTVPILFGITGGASQQKSSSISTSGLADMPFLKGQVGGNVGSSLITSNNALANRASTPFTFPTLNAQGLFPEQSNLFDYGLNQSVNNAANYFSGNYANRGFLNPENIGAIVGSAAQNVAPQYASLFAPYSAANLTARTTLPEQIGQSRYAQLLASLGLSTSLLTGSPTSVSSGSGSGFNFGVGGSTPTDASAAKAAGAMLFA